MTPEDINMHKDLSFLGAFRAKLMEGFTSEFTPLRSLPQGRLSWRGNIHKGRPFGKIVIRADVQGIRRYYHVTKGWRGRVGGMEP